jgi:hypothetical protein
MRVERRGHRHGGAPFVAKITHSLAGATITTVPRPAKKGQWRVDIVATVHGRSWTRPLAFVALPFMRGRPAGSGPGPTGRGRAECLAPELP